MNDEERKERRRQQVRESYHRNKDKYKDNARERSRKWYQDNKHRPEVVERLRGASRQRDPAVQMYLGARYRAERGGMPFNLEQRDVVVPAVCPVFGEPFQVGTQWGPSLDRIKPELGYVKGNVAVISRYANTIKNCGTADDHRKIADWMDTFCQQGTYAS